MQMLVPTIVMVLVAAFLYFLAWRKGGGAPIEGLEASGRMALEMLPLLLCALLVAGVVPVLLPKEALARWVGAESGLRGVLIGSLAGGLAPGGPYVSLPVAAGLVQAGAGVGTMVAFLTGWSLWAVARLPLEVGVLGWKLTLIRLACVLVFPPLAGGIGYLLFEGRAGS